MYLRLKVCLPALMLLLIPVLIYAQDMLQKSINYNSTDIFIPLEGREEVKIIPLLDTLSADKEYLFLIRFSPKYRFSELFFDKGLASRMDTFLSVRPKTNLTEGIDTATLRIIGFSNNGRVLLIHRFFLLAHTRAFPMVNPSKSINITVNNIVLERNMNYDKRDFPEKCAFGYLENGHYNKDNLITSITLSLIGKYSSKNLVVKDSKPSEEMIKEIHKAKKGTRVYIRLDVKNGKRSRSTWTSFYLND